MTNKTDLFFDLDHTLWDFDRNSHIAFETIFEKEFPKCSIAQFMTAYIPINQACWKLYQNNEITHNQLRYNRLKLSFDAVNWEITDLKIDQIATKYIELLPTSNHLFEGAIDTLDYLFLHYNLHIITNGFEQVQQQKMENSGLHKYFKTITNSEMAGQKKPSPVIYQYALSQAKTNKDNAVMIGDCIDADIKGAISFGMDAIFFNPNKQPIDIEVVQIETLLALKNIF